MGLREFLRSENASLKTIIKYYIVPHKPHRKQSSYREEQTSGLQRLGTEYL